MWTKVQFVAARSTVAAAAAAAGGEENGVCQAQAMSSALSEAVWAFLYTCVVSCGERAEMRGLVGGGVWLGVKVYLTTLPGSERQTVPQPPHVASVICKGDQGSMRPDGWFHLVVI